MPSWMPTVKPLLTIAFLAVFWTWESIAPLVSGRTMRFRHARRNLAIALLNTAVLALVFGAATVGVSAWTSAQQVGLLNVLNIPWPWRLVPAILLLDGWLYLWHQLNHRVPLLWRFHRMHHADGEMDVTTATRFHLGEHLGAASLRLGLIPLLGVNLVEIVVFEILVVLITMFHHAYISLGRLDSLVRTIIVTPRMHQIHHSRQPTETNSNYSTLFSIWDRLFRTFRMRSGSEVIALGLDEFQDDRWQTVGGMLKTPMAAIPSDSIDPRLDNKARN